MLPDPGTALCAVVAVAGLAVPLLVVAWHLGDAFGLDHTSGVWLGLAEWARHGVLLPGPHDGGVFGGSRYMPLPVAMDAAAGTALGSTMAGARVVAVLGTAALLAVVFRGARDAGLARWPAALLIAVLTAGAPVSLGITSVRNDALPAAAQLLAVLLVTRSSRRRALPVAGALCGLAPMLKISAVWGIGAVLVVAVLGAAGGARRWRRVGAVAAGFVPCVLAGLAGGELATGGRLSANLRLTLFSPEDSPLDVPAWLPRLLADATSSLGGLLPILVVGVGALLATRRCVSAPDPLRAAAACCLLVTCAVYADRASSANHLIDLLALGALGTARLAACRSGTAVTGPSHPARPAVPAARHPEPRGAGPDHPTPHPALGLTAVTCAIILATAWYNPALTVVKRAHPAEFTPATTGPVLTEDPAVDVAAGRPPVVVDAFAFRRMALADPAYATDLAARITAHEFTAIVLLAAPPRTEPTWYTAKHFGPTVITAICTAYHSAGLTPDGKFDLYLPTPPTTPPTTPPCLPTPALHQD